MKITLSSIFVNDQDKALKFYTEILGFEKKTEIPIGNDKWLTVIAPEGSPDIELVLEPNHHTAARAYQSALYKDGIPATSFESARRASAFRASSDTEMHLYHQYVSEDHVSYPISQQYLWSPYSPA